MTIARILRRRDGFLLEAGGEMLPLHAYMTYQAAKGDFAAFRRMGCRLVCVGVWASDRGINPMSGTRPFRPGFWRAPGEFDFAAADADFSLALGDAAPGEVWLIPRLVLNPPRWWERAHPEALARDQAGEPCGQSFGSEVWLDACRVCMTAFHDWLERSGWARYVAGWHLAGGATEEFLRPRCRPGQYLDYSDSSLAAYRAWLRTRYRNDGALRSAWNDPAVSLADAAFPPAARRAFASGAFRDPALEQPVIDALRFHSETVADHICALCRAAKKITDGSIVVGAFYGYFCDVLDPEIGHHALARLLDDDAVDFLASPFSYLDLRAEGQDWPFQSAVASARFHSKPWLLECDVRTHLSRGLRASFPAAAPVSDVYEGGVWLGPPTAEGSLGQLGKAFAKTLTGGGGLWWFDMWGGWFDDPAYRAFHSRAFEVYAEAQRAGVRSAAQLAVFVDERSFASFAPDGAFARALIPAQLLSLGFAGLPFDTFLLSDLPLLAPGGYRAVLFLSPVRLTDAERSALARWRSGGRALLFAGLPDIYGGGVRAATGFDLALPGGDAPVRAEGRYGVWPREPVEMPRAVPRPAPGDIVLARQPDGSPAALVRVLADHTVWWSLAPDLPAALIRDAASLAGAHIYSHGGDVVYASDRFVAMHAASDGCKRLYPARPGVLTDVFTGERLDADPFSEFPMRRGETRLFEAP